MSGNGALRDKVAEAISAGKLPNRNPERTWAGPGCGACCVICGELVRADELEFEVQFATGDNGDRPEDYHAHRGCFLAWDSARRKLELERATAVASELLRAVGDARLTADEREGPA